MAGLCVIELDPSGILGWYRVISGPIMGQSATPLSEGGFAVCGETFDLNTFATNSYAASFDASGNIRWGKEINLFESEVGTAITEATNGDLLIGGWQSFADDSASSASQSAAFFIRMDKNGEFLNANKMIVPNLNSILNGMIPSLDGGFIYTGAIGENLSIGPFGLLLGKLDDSGNGCNMKSQLVSVSVTDSFFVGGAIRGNALTTSSFDFTASSGFTLNQNDICTSGLSVKPSADFSDENISLYPNPLPGNEALRVHVSEFVPAGIYELRILDLLGNIVDHEQIYLTHDILFTPPGLAAGTYIIGLQNESDPKISFHVKLLKQE